MVKMCFFYNDESQKMKEETELKLTFLPVILATTQTKAAGSQVQDLSRELSETLSQKIIRKLVM